MAGFGPGAAAERKRATATQLMPARVGREHDANAVAVLAIVVHGFPFSVLWAALGRDSSLRLRANEMGTKLDVNWALNGALLFVTVFGFVVSPLITGWWLTSMKNDNHHDKTK